MGVRTDEFEPRAEIYNRPPPNHTTPNIRKTPRSWDGLRCLSAKQWQQLSSWLDDHRELCERYTADVIARVAAYTEAGLPIALASHGFVACPVGKPGCNAIVEAAKTAKVEFGKSVIDFDDLGALEDG